jgi:NADH:ubiquinone oxidoreductase subunit 5 (subunit L)/multisubunit Na+/H+ antiporter MnhA subunit
MAIAGLPPLNGFATEWLTLQSLLHLATTGGLGVAVAGGLTTAGLAITAGLAVLCFVKVVGLVLLGPPRRPECANAVEAPLPIRAAVGFLAALCVVLGVLPGLLLPKLAALAPGDVSLATHAGLRLPGTGSLPAPGLAIALAAITGALLLARGARRAAPAPVWVCGQRIEPVLSWTSAGFTKPLRLVLEVVLRPERTVTVRSQGGVVQEAEHVSSVPHLFDTLLYEPVVRVSLAGAAVARRLQSGSLRGYVLYLLALVVTLLVLARTGALA